MILNGLTLAAPPLLDFEATDEHDAIRRTADLLASDAGITHFGGFVNAVFDRQKFNPPLLGNGVAMPHARTVLANDIVCVASRCARPVPFGLEATPIQLIFLIGVPPHRIDEYLKLTAILAQRLRDPLILDGLINANNADEFAEVLA